MNVNDHVKRCVERCGINKDFHTHLARHTMASLVAEYCSWDVLKGSFRSLQTVQPQKYIAI